MAEEHNPVYDFDYLCRALNLLPFNASNNQGPFEGIKGAFNSTAIISIKTEYNQHVFSFYDGSTIMLNDAQMAELEQTIKRRLKEAEEMRVEAIRADAEMRAQAELNAANEAIAQAAMRGRLKGLKRSS